MTVGPLRRATSVNLTAIFFGEAQGARDDHPDRTLRHRRRNRYTERIDSTVTSHYLYEGGQTERRNRVAVYARVYVGVRPTLHLLMSRGWKGAENDHSLESQGMRGSLRCGSCCGRNRQRRPGFCRRLCWLRLLRRWSLPAPRLARSLRMFATSTFQCPATRGDLCVQPGHRQHLQHGLCENGR